MGTRSTYRVIDQWFDEKKEKTVNSELVLVYLQFDGYPEGHPLEVAKWLSSGEVVNGFGLETEKLLFNGAGCLAAQLIAKLKNGTGGTYIHHLKSRGRCWENYTYDIIVKEDKTLEFICYEVGGNERPRFIKLFSGTPAEFVEKYETEKVGS